MTNIKNESQKQKNGFTLIEVLIAVFLILVIFLAIFGVYRLSIAVVRQSKNKISAGAIAFGQIEKIRNLPYESIGIKGIHANGVLESSTTTIQNGTNFTVETIMEPIADIIDGAALPQDSCPQDYKKVQIKVFWSGILGGQIKAVTDIAPKNVNQECSLSGGILYVSVFDALGQMVLSPLIEIKNATTGALISSNSPIDGQHYFSLATSTYRVMVSKPGYSSERTYGLNEIVVPDKPNPIIIDKTLTEVSFSIDRVSTLSVSTLSSWGSDYFSDSFLDSSKISTSSNLIISGGQAILATTSSGYVSSGYFISNTIYPTSSELIDWDQLTYSDTVPSGTKIRYQVLYLSGANWVLIIDGDLPGNSAGLSPPPIDLGRLDPAEYPKIRIKITLFSDGGNRYTPTLYNLYVSWLTTGTVFAPNINFSLRGNKIIGTNSSEESVYKYSIATTTDSDGRKDIANLEWDSYTFSVDSSSGLTLTATDPALQPISLAPDSYLSVKLFLTAQNSLMVSTKDLNTASPVFSASVRAYNTTIGYDKTQYTNAAGQTYFIPLQNKTYNLQISAPGYLSTSTTVTVSGAETKIINLEPED
jgi:prepilin-type N-terminal cleavage/methylation domain-containing protein